MKFLPFLIAWNLCFQSIAQDINQSFKYQGKDINSELKNSIFTSGIATSTINYSKFSWDFEAGLFIQYDYFLLRNNKFNITIGSSPKIFFPIVNFRLPGTVGFLFGQMANHGAQRNGLGFGLNTGYEVILIPSILTDQGFLYRFDIMFHKIVISYQYSTSKYFTHKLMGGARIEF